jgi:hypothetical protein
MPVAGANLQLQVQLLKTGLFQQGQKVEGMHYVFLMQLIQVCLQLPPLQAICQLSKDLCCLKDKLH